MQDDRRIPKSLTVVAYLFIAGGVFAALDILMSLAEGRVNLDFGVLGLLIGPGLIRLQPGWRICALVVLGLCMVMAPIFAALVVADVGTLSVSVLGQLITAGSKELALLCAAAAFALSSWQYRTLTSTEIHKLFEHVPGELVDGAEER